MEVIFRSGTGTQKQIIDWLLARWQGQDFLFTAVFRVALGPTQETLGLFYHCIQRVRLRIGGVLHFCHHQYGAELQERFYLYSFFHTLLWPHVTPLFSFDRNVFIIFLQGVG